MSVDSTLPVAETAPPFDAALAAIIGRRTEQQDAGRVSAVRLSGGGRGLLILVADGMGGHAGGAEASHAAIATFYKTFAAGQRLPTAKRLRDALLAANTAIGERVAADRALTGMGCTLVAAVLEGRSLTWISVGDTLLLVSSKSGLQRLNADHSLGGVLDERAARGEITHEEARTNPQRHMLRAAVTGDRIPLIDENAAELEPGELVVVATDGVLTIPPERLASLLALAATPSAAVSSVLGAVSADMPDDQDNTTVAAARVSSQAAGSAMAAPGRRAWRTAVALLAFLVVLAAVSVLALVAWQELSAQSPKAPARAGPVPAAQPPAAPVEPPTATSPNVPTGKSGGYGPASGAPAATAIAPQPGATASNKVNPPPNPPAATPVNPVPTAATPIKSKEAVVVLPAQELIDPGLMSPPKLEIHGPPNPKKKKRGWRPWG